MQKWLIVTVAIVFIAFAGLFYVVRSGNSSKGFIDGIGCLPNGHQNLAQHIHPEISIRENGVEQPIPANIGVSQTCMRWLHTHDSSGIIHLETVDRRDLTLGQFLSVWRNDKGNTPLDNKAVANVTVNGESYTGDYNSIILKDRQRIVITIS